MVSHHAVIRLAADPVKALSTLEESVRQDAEMVPYAVPSLTIEDVRRIIVYAYQTPDSHPKRMIAIATRTINREAQHALLKVLEEPPATTVFLIIVPTLAGLLPTVLSRVIVEESRDGGSESTSRFLTFLTTSIKERLELIADIAKRKADEEYDELYDGLVSYVPTMTELSILKDIEAALRFLRQKGAAKKMIWEHLALTIPVVSKQ
ncbi:MAG: polymerase delta prime subunit [Candidatus Parcubacteria bacterium]|jgi:DNA polymerase III delta prime subunit